MFEQFPYTNFHELNLDWIIDQLRRTMESAVLSVNGQTGDVVLYQSENVVFPDVASPQWRMVRTADGHIAGVMFQNGLMYVMYDGTADRVYTINNPPPYPVTSVDGQTGAVQVFPNAATRLPDVQDDYTNIRRQIETNGTQNIVGIELKQNKAYRMVDNNRYEMYDSDNPPPYPVTSVNGNTGAIVIAIPFEDVTTSDIEFADASTDHYWSLGRETLDGTASIQLYTNSTTAEAYIDFYDGQGVTYTKKLLTVDDIPSSSGVVSINGLTGVVTMYGDTMPIEAGSPDSVKDVTDDLNTRLGTAENTITQHGTDIGTLSTGISNTQADIAIVENTNNATHNITAGDYVVWKGSLYTASSNISIGDGLSGSNLSAVSNGGLNALLDKITWKDATFTSATGWNFNNQGFKYTDDGKVFITGYFTSHTQVNSPTQIGSVPAGTRPIVELDFEVPISNGTVDIGTAVVTIAQNGNVSVATMSATGIIVLRVSYLTGQMN